MRASRAALALVVALSGACAGARPPTLRTGAAALPTPWRKIASRGASVALHHADGGAIAASVQCDAADEDAPLEVLVQHLLMQLDGSMEHERRVLTLDGRAALRVRLAVRLDGVPVELDLVVLKKDGCVVDAQLVAAGAVAAARRADFDRFVAGLALSRSAR